MAVDKLVDSAQLDTDLTAVADAIRTKGGTSESLAFPNGFVDAIDAIETGGGGDLDALIDRSITSIENDTVTVIGRSAFAYCKSLVSASFPNVTTINSDSFADCTALKNVYLPRAYTLAGFIRSGIEEINRTNFARAVRCSSSAFYQCTSLRIAVFGHETPYEPSKNSAVFDGSVFINCSNLEVFDSYISMSRGGDFVNCSKLSTIILRRSGRLFALGATSWFQRTPFASDGAGGTVYVPQALLSDYQNATNWSTILSYENNKILPIEGSQYENYYADGTPVT